MVEDGYRSIKEYWLDPKNERRSAAGRRESDYIVCHHHKDTIAECKTERENVWKKFEMLEEKIVGKWTFGVIVTILLSVITLSTGASVLMFQSIKQDIKAHIDISK